MQIKDTDIEISSANKKIKKYVPLSKRQDKTDSALWLIKHHPQLKDSQIAKLIGITKIDLITRKSGCAALDMAYVAAGRYDGYFQNNLNLWDIAAGIIIVKEAGGIINEINLSENDNIKIRASSTAINEKMLKKLQNF